MDDMPSKPPAPFVSVIIPAWNEAAGLAATIGSAQCPFIKHEILVVDGGSADATVQIASENGCRVFHSARRQRAAQMNLGAAHARGEVFLFLHADTRLAPGAFSAMREALRDSRVVGGAFARRYDSPSRLLAVTCRLAQLRNRLVGWHLGDQAIFARGHIFQRCGPFAEVAQFEDLDFSRQLRRCGRIVTLQPPVRSAVRRFAKDGALLRTAKDFLLTCGYFLRGLPAATCEGRVLVPLAEKHPQPAQR